MASFGIASCKVNHSLGQRKDTTPRELDRSGK
jgi:hypothetical protein